MIRGLNVAPRRALRQSAAAAFPDAPTSAGLSKHFGPMAPSPSEPERPAPRLYLFTPAADGAAIEQALAAALEAAEVAAVLLRLPNADENGLTRMAKPIAALVQQKGAALLLEGHARLVARAGADGAHLDGPEALADELEFLKPDRIAGCGGLLSRHDAMTAAEAGADYVMFGEPDAHGARPAFEAVLERVEWWAEVFEAPCVGFAASLDEVTLLARAGADFVALGDCVWSDPRGPAAAIADAAARLKPEPAA